MKKVIKDIFFNLMFNTSSKLQDLHIDLPFLPKREMLKKVGKLVTNLHKKCYTYKKFKTGIKSWVNFEKSS